MKRKSLLFLLLMAIFAPWAAKAQQKLTDYTLATDVTTFNSIVSTGTQLSFSSIDDGYAAFNFPFKFAYGESNFTTDQKIACSANGFIQLGSTSTSGSTPSYTSNNRVITPLPQFDGYMGRYDDAGAYWEYDETAQTLTIEYHKLGAYSQTSGTYGIYSYQIVLHKNGDIEFIYDEVDHQAATSRTMATYLTDGAKSDRLYVKGEWASPEKTTTYTTRPFTPVPEHGLRYTFTRPVIAYPAPTTLQMASSDHESASLAWTAPEAGPNTLTGYAYEYKPASQTSWSDNWTTLNDASATTLTIHSLAASTSYNFRMKALYGSNESDIVTTDFNTTAMATAVGDSWSDDFEGTECGWSFVNTSQTNQWYWGTAVHTGEGTHAIYVSNNGTANEYTNNSTSVVYATKLLGFTDGKYTFDYNWMANGEGSYDYIHVWLAPGSFTFTSGQFPNGATYNFSSYTNLVPEGWISLTGSGKLNGQTSWQSKSWTVNVPAGNWFMVFMWCNDSSGGSNPPAAIDNVSITKVACPYDVTNLTASTVGQTSATLTWNGGGASQWIVSYSANSSFENATEVTVSEETYTIPNNSLTPSTDYYVKVRAYCGGTDYGSWCEAYHFVTECPDNYPLGYTCGFEGPNTTGSNPMPLCWTRMGSHTTQPYVVTSQHHGDEGTRSLYFYKASSETYNNEIAALPAIDANLKDVRVVFYGKLSSASEDGTINVGYVTSLTDAASFHSVEPVTLSTEWERYIVSFGGVGNATGNIAFQSFYNSATAYIYIDDVTVEAIPDCVEPSGLAEVPETATENSLTFNWTAGGTETTWRIQYKKSTETEWTTYPNAVTEKPFELPGLEASSVYNVRVAAWCTLSDPDGISGYTEPVTAKTECGAFPVAANHHYSDNFNSYTAGTSSSSAPSNYPNDELPLCWSFLNRSQTSSTYPQVFLSSISNYSVSGNCLFFKSSKDTPLYAILPEFENNISDLMLTFTYRNEGTGTANGTLYVSYMTNPADATTFNTDNAIMCEQTSTKTEKEVFFDNAPADSYIAFMYQGGTSNNYYLGIDDVKVELAPSCRKPSALKCDSKTAHTATFSWTNGAATQNAWQIAYSTNSSFNPDADFTPNGTTEWLADVTTNPGTIEGLAQSTTYYAYVRANCGGGDYSAWCKDKVTFSTVAGNVTPTGLAVEAASRQATASWNAVAGNTLHQSYDIYWATADVTAVPDEPAAPNLISGITATTQVINGLTPETNYKVWVRDYCGTDGYSNWSSAVPFTTDVACPAPTNVAASNVTNNSADISWEGNAASYNLRYRAFETPTTATVILTVDGDVWGDGSGYQMVLDADANMYDDIISGAITDYSDFEYLIPNDATYDPDGSVVFDESVSITIPAGTYDWVIYNPSPGDDVYVAGGNYQYGVGGYKNDYVFEAGKTYEFVVSYDTGNNYDRVDVTITNTATTDGNWTVVENVTSPQPISPLTDEQMYEVQVQAVCGGEDGESAWTTSITFTTLSNCSAPTELNVTELTAASAKLNWTGAQDSYNVRYAKLIPGEPVTTTEDFSGQTAVGYDATNGELPAGWKSFTTGSYVPHVSNASNYSFISSETGNYLLMTGNTSGGGVYAIMPQYDNLTAVSFNYAFESTSNCGSLEVGYVTDNTGYSTFTSLQEIEPEDSNVWHSYTLTSTDIATINNNKGYIAFMYNSITTTYYSVALDDVAVTYQALTPGAWNTDNTNVTSPLPINNLEMNTKYEWQVQGINAGCGDNGLTEWSAKARFTTLATFTKTIAGYGNSEGGYVLIASPLAGETNPTNVKNMIDAEGNYDLYYFDQAQTDEWRNYKADAFNLTSGKGYLYASKNDVTLTFTGTPYSGNGEVDLTYSTAAIEFPGWNLIGNPFAKAATLDKPFYQMNADGDGFTAKIEDLTNTIAAMEGVFVETTATEVTATFTPQTSKGGQQAIAQTNIFVSGNKGQVLDNAVIRFDGGQQLDKFSFREGSTKVFITEEGKDYAVVNAGHVGEIPVSFKAEKNGTYSLNFTSQEVCFSYLHLIDNLTGNDVDLLANPSYSFDAQVTDYAQRFKLVFATGSSAEGDSFGFVNGMGNLCIFGIEGEATIQVIDILGHVITSDTFSGSYERKLNVAPGVYMIRLINGNDVKVQKIVVR